MRVVFLPTAATALSLSVATVQADYENLSLLGTASSSSVAGLSSAGNAIDGNRDGTNTSSVFSSDGLAGAGEWWELDLGSEYQLDKVLVFPRSDLASGSLRDFTLEVLDASNAIVFSADFLGAGTTGDAPWGTVFNGVNGQRVKITLRAPNNFALPAVLEFAEVEIWGDTTNELPTNIASSATVSSSSPGFGTTQDNGIDGDLASNYNAGSDADGPIFHDEPAAGQGFYRLDFPTNHSFDKVELYNRVAHNGTGVAVQTTTRYRVSILDENSNVVTARMAVAAAVNYDHVLDFGGTIGRSILIEEVNPAEFLAFAEVRVFGAPTMAQVSPIVNLAPRGTANSSSSGFGGLAEFVNDGSRDGRFAAGSVFHSAGGTGPGEWIEVDLGTEFHLDRIMVFPRTDQQQNSVRDFTLEIFDAEGLVVWASDYLTTSDTGDDPWGTAAMSGTSGRRVRLTLRNPNNSAVNFLTLAELEIWGSESPLPANLAPTASLSASTPGFGATIDNGVDHDLAGNFYSITDVDGPMFHDEAAPGQGFYRLDFENDTPFGEVQLYNRTQNNAVSTTTAYRVSVLNESDEVIATQEVIGGVSNYDHILHFGNITGQTLLIEESNEAEFLAFSEIRVLSVAPVGNSFPYISNISRNPTTGELTFTAHVRPETNYAFEASSDLVNWLEIDDFSSADTTITLAHTPETGTLNLFYRIREF